MEGRVMADENKGFTAPPKPVPDREALREAIAAKIKDAYYAARDSGGTMHTAADDAADALLSGPLAGVLAENERLRKPDLRMMYGYELGIEDGKAERDALAAKVAAVAALADEWDAMGPGRSGYATALRAALDTPEGEK